MKTDIEQRLLDFLQNQSGYQALEPEGLIHPAFPDTFAASAFHWSIGQKVREGGEGSYAGAEWCFRHVDIEKSGASPIHLSSFRMLVFFDVHAPTDDSLDFRETAVRTFVRCLERLGLDPRNVTTTFFGGGEVQGVYLPPDEEVVALWRKYGVENVVPLPGESNLTNIARPGEPAGPRCEVFYRHPDFLQPVEIGTLVFERYLLDGGFKPAKGLVYGGAFGIERLAMAVEGTQSIFACSALDGLTRTVTGELDPQLAPLVQSDVFRIVDALRSLAILISAGGDKTEGKRKERIKKLGRVARNSFKAIGLHDSERIGCIVSHLMEVVDLREFAGAQPKDELHRRILSVIGS